MEFTVKSVSQIFWYEDIRKYSNVLSKYGYYVREDKCYKITILSLDELSALGKEIYEFSECEATLDINFVDMRIEIVDDVRD